MHLIALHDEAGSILAGVIEDGEHPTPVPVADAGHMLARIELDDEQARMPLEELCTRMRVDPGSGRLIPSEESAAG